MKHTILALPALLRTSIILTAASQTTFNVQDDLLAFPQYEVYFSDDYLSESQAQARLSKNVQGEDDIPSHLAQYNPPESPPSSDGTSMDDVKLEYESILLDDQRYLCSIPQVKKPEMSKPSNDTISKADKEKELARANDRGWQLLSGMQGNCVYYISGWWSYRFCYNNDVRQFHQLPPSKDVPPYPPVEDPTVEGFTLGRYKGPEGGSGDANKKQTGQQNALDVSESSAKKVATPNPGDLVQRGESRYLVQKLDGGTKCDLTGKDRRIEVQFHCNPHSAEGISLVKEINTCTYLMVIQTPRLCHDVAFLPPQKEKANEIKCSPVLAEDEVEVYNDHLKEIKKAEQDAKVRAATAEAARILTGQEPPQVVGGLVVGGHRYVPEDVKLEKSAIVGGGKVKYVDTIASSDGKVRKVLSKEELEKLGVGDQKALEEVMKQVENMAGNDKWKLEVIDTPRGREYRAILGTNDEEDEKEDEKKKQDGKGEEGSQEEYFHEEL